MSSSKNVQISVIIPVFNQERFMGRCLRSILNQSIPRTEYEIILIDDASTDNTPKIVEKFASELQLIKHSENKGLPASLNSGIKLANGRFIIRLDSDDYVHHEYLNILSLYLKMNSHVDAVSCDYIEVDNKENVLTRKCHKDDPIGCGIMFRIEQLIEIGLYDEEQHWHEERELMERFLKSFSLEHLNFPLYRYRKHDNNMTSNQEMMDKYKDILDHKSSLK